MISKYLIALLMLVQVSNNAPFKIRPSVEEALYSRPDLLETQPVKTLPDRQLALDYRASDLEKLANEFLATVQPAYPAGRQDITVGLDGLKQLSDRFDKVIYYEIRETPSASPGSGAEKYVSLLPKMVDEHGLSTKKPYSVLPLLKGGYRCEVLTIRYSEAAKKWLFYAPTKSTPLASTTCQAIAPEKLIVMVSCSAERVKASEAERQQIQKRLESALNNEIETLSHDRYPNITTAAQQEREFYRTAGPASQAKYARVYHFVLKIEFL